MLAAWSRATPGPTAAVYLELRNTGADSDRLMGATSPAAERIEFHEHRMVDGVMSMNAVPQIDLPAGKTATLAPGGRHLMLFGLAKPLRPGDRLSLTLRFEMAGEITVEAWDKKLAVYRHAVWQDSGQWAFTTNEPSYVAVEQGMPLTRELEHFIGCIGSRAEPRTNGEEAIAVLRILTAGTVAHVGGA